jgi:hypothetical protein
MRIVSFAVLVALMLMEPAIRDVQAQGGRAGQTARRRWWWRKKPPPPPPVEKSPADTYGDQGRTIGGDGPPTAPAPGSTGSTPGVIDPPGKDPGAGSGPDGGGRRRSPFDRAPIDVHRRQEHNVTRGRATKITFTVNGTRERVRLHVRNLNPKIGKVRGGNDQHVMTTGGEPNVATVTATGLRGGTFAVTADVDRDELIARVFRRELRRIAAKLERAAAELQRHAVRGTIGTGEVLRLIDQTEAEIDQSLPFPELDAFYDAVREHMTGLRKEVLAISTARRSGDGAIQLVSQSVADGPSVPANPVKGLFSGLVRWVLGISENSPQVEICVFATPLSIMSFRLHPQYSASEDEQKDRATPTRFSIYVGLYAWKIFKQDRYLERTGTVNFLEDPDRVVECTLRHTGPASMCEPIQGALDRWCHK